MPQCNHENVTTKFCPHCGQAMAGTSAVASLLAYVKRTAQKQAHDLEVAIQKYGEDSPGAIRGSAKLKKWNGWVVALEQLVETKE